MYSRLRRSDFLPVGEEKETEVLERGYWSLSSEEEEGAGLEAAFASDSEEDESEHDGPREHAGSIRADFA